MFTKQFWLDAIERAIRSAAQGALVAIGARFAVPEAFVAVDLDSVGATAVAALVTGLAMGLLSLLTSLATAPLGPSKTTPSVVQDLEHQGLL